jgi:hypothetical protein
VSSHLFRSKLFLLQHLPPSSHTIGILILQMPPAPQNSSRTSLRPISRRKSLQRFLLKGSSFGRVNFGLTGGRYGPSDQFNTFIAPLFNTLPKPSGQTITPGTYIESVQNLGGLGRLNTTGDTPDTFYAKSIMTPEKAPMSVKALNAFMSYLADPGFTADTVRLISKIFHKSASFYYYYYYVFLQKKNKT